MARSTRGPNDTPAIGKAPVRRKAVGARAVRKAEAEAPGRTAIEADVAAEGTHGAHGGSAPTNDEIAKRAYELYLRRGSSDGHDLDDWIEAERQLRGSGSR